MAVNLLNSSDYETARITLDSSFAQWEANESAWQLESQMATLRSALDDYEQAFQCSHGDFTQFMTLRMELSDIEKDGRRKLKHEVFLTDQSRSQAFQQLETRIQELRKAEREHPCRNCPDMQQHLKWGHRWARESRELARVSERYESRTGSVARQFDRICDILTQLGYLNGHANGEGTDTILSDKGRLLRRIYSEHDLELCETLLAGTFDKLDANGLAAVLSSLVYEARRGGEGEPRHYPGGVSGPIAIACSKLKGICAHISALCEDQGLNEPHQPDFGIVDIIFEWADGGSLSSCLYGTDMTGGDFVRTAKRLADVLQQIAVADPLPFDGAEALSDIAHEAAGRINRGIVAYSGVD
jgi:ATP-dependent RNA helicase HelY